MGGSTVRIVWPRDGTSEIQNLERCNFLSIVFFLWVEHVWSSGRVRRQRDVNKLNMSKMIKMWIERGKCDGKGENIKGNALLADFTHFLTLASREFVVSLLYTYDWWGRITQVRIQVGTNLL